ncbi:MAG: threonylcarbamoyl-AMP synthase [Acidovorax sp.]|nr:threonylcarbamoyl-AMP synthase [Acidovorax sp.]
MPVLAGDDPAALAAAAQCLAGGGLVGLPTETVYGLGARADDDAAVAGIFTAKGRPADHPLIVHVAGLAQAAAFTGTLPDTAQRLAAAFWPGPVTVIVLRRAGVATAAAGGQPSIGLRCPSHPVAQALLQRAATLGVPGVAAPSANRFGRISPTTAAHVAAEFGPGLLVLDGGPCPVGIESTIVDCSRSRPVLLRPGVLTRAALEAVLGERLLAADADAPRAPGTLAAHYAPRARLRLVPADTLAAALDKPATWPPGLAVYSRRPVGTAGACLWRAMPDDAASAAQDLFAALRRLDDDGAAEIWVEQPPDDPAWDGVLDRLRRAASA